MKVYADKHTATKAARKVIGAHAKKGVDFNLRQLDVGRWVWEPIAIGDE